MLFQGMCQPLHRLAIVFTLIIVTLATQALADDVTIGGTMDVIFDTLGEGRISGIPTLGYKTEGPFTKPGATTRAITVKLLEAFPAGLTGTVSFTPDIGNGVSMGTVELSTTPQILVDLINPDIEQFARSIGYVFNATNGFMSTNISIEYSIIEK